MNTDVLIIFAVAIAIIAVVALVAIARVLITSSDKRARDIGQAVLDGYKEGLQVIHIDQVDKFIEARITQLEAFAKNSPSPIDDVLAAFARHGYVLISQDDMLDFDDDNSDQPPAAESAAPAGNVSSTPAPETILKILKENNYA